MKTKERNRLDKVSLELCKKNAGYKCEICGKDKSQVQLHTHHIIGRRHLSLRWWLPNLICLCAQHHLMGLQSAHENPVWFLEVVETKRGSRAFKCLKQRQNEIFKGTFGQVSDYLDGKTKDYL